MGEIWNGLDPAIWGELAYAEIVYTTAPATSGEDAGELLAHAARLLGTLANGETVTRESAAFWVDEYVSAALLHAWDVDLSPSENQGEGFTWD
jgi:hypothetical protein